MHHCLNRLAAALAPALAPAFAPAFAPLLVLGLPLLASAQGRADLADPRTPARALAHRSAFADYKPFEDIALGDWRGLNASVGRAALKSGDASTDAGVRQAAPAASGPAAKPPMPHMPGHHQHMKEGQR